MASVLLVDDHALYREGLRELFAKWDDFEVVDEVSDGLEAVAKCSVNPPDLVIMDVKMPVMDGIEACGAIRRDHPETVVVMLSLYAERERVLSAIAAGAQGYLLKSMYARQLHDRLRSVMAGGAALSEDVAAICLDAIRSSRFTMPVMDEGTRRTLGLLTKHEEELLRLVAIGASNREIGERLFIGESTVKKQLSALMVKLGLKNRVQAATFALRAGLAD